MIIPSSLQESVLAELHMTHTGVCRMKSLTGSHVWLPKLDKDIEDLASSCVSCQRVKHLLLHLFHGFGLPSLGTGSMWILQDPSWAKCFPSC